MRHTALSLLLALLATASPAAAQTPRVALRTTESIVDYLKSKKLDSSLDARKKLYAERFGTKDYAGTHAQNVRLLESMQLASSDEVKSAYCAIDATTVTVKGARTAEEFDALPKDQVRVATIDLHPTRKAGEPRYYVVLSARETKLPETVGHAWVAFGIRGTEKEDPEQCIGSAFGNFPKEGKKAALSAFVPIPGKVTKGWLENAGEKEGSEKVRLVLEVSEAAYRSARDVVASTTTKEDYQLLTNDCVEMARTVAKAVGLEVAEKRETIPTSEVEAILRRNLHKK
ncbi:MAG: hypothetical protein JNK15_12615 [Planctomycetes bacterium]|nr:hypothetical protein [Planctomycetota bacterium]